MTRIPKRLIDAIVAARCQGATLRQAAKAAGVHVSTLCRWQKRCPALKAALDQIDRQASRGAPKVAAERPAVSWRRDCPKCKARVVVRKVGRVPFWRCGCWPRCDWASWRPRAPRDCPRCLGPRYWSHSRKSVSCDCCQLRTSRALTSAQFGADRRPR